MSNEWEQETPEGQLALPYAVEATFPHEAEIDVIMEQMEKDMGCFDVIPGRVFRRSKI